jgi:hypothetical protein
MKKQTILDSKKLMQIFRKLRKDYPRFLVQSCAVSSNQFTQFSNFQSALIKNY